MWEMVKNIKVRLSINQHCPGYRGFYGEVEVEANVATLAETLKVEASEQMLKNITDKNLKASAEMFLYLNSCSRLNKKWLLLYTDLYQDKSPDQIILTLNRILKGTETPQNKEFKNIAYKLLKRTAAMFPSPYNYEQSVNFANKILNEPFNNLKKGIYIRYI